MGGFSSVTGDETIMFADNVSFDGTQRGGKITTDGQLLIGATAAPHIRPGTLTSSGGTVTITPSAGSINLEVAGGAPYISLSPYIVGTDVHSGFATIQSAITQAVVDGASATDQKNIYIKPKSGGYTENLTLSDGINLVGFAGVSGEDNGMTFVNSIVSAVQINGTITISSAGQSSLNDLTFTVSAATNSISISDSAYLKINRCIFNLGSGAFLSLSGGSPTVDLSNSIVRESGSAKFFDTGLSPACNINIGRSTISCETASVVAAATAVTITGSNSSMLFPVDASVSTGGLNITFVNCSWNSNSPPLLLYGAATIGSVNLSYCSLGAVSPLFSGDVSSVLTITRINCFVSTTLLDSDVANYSNWNNINTNLIQLEQKFNNSGYQGSDYIQRQGQVQTTDATVTGLVILSLNVLESVTLKGQVTGAQDDHTNAVGGDFLITARRAFGGDVTLIGSIVTNVNSSSAATFTVSVDSISQTVLLTVTGVAATTYNWVATYTYQKILTNA